MYPRINCSTKCFYENMADMNFGRRLSYVTERVDFHWQRKAKYFLNTVKYMDHEKLTYIL